MTERPWAFIDIESDGLRPERLAWEFAVIRRAPDGTENRREFFIELSLVHAEAKALEMSHFWDRHPLGRYISHLDPSPPVSSAAYLEPQLAAMEVARWTHDCILVGANPAFDALTLTQLLRGQGLTPSWFYRMIDVEALTYGRLQSSVGGLTACAKALGIEVNAETEHRAMADALVARAVFDRVMAPVLVPA